MIASVGVGSAVAIMFAWWFCALAHWSSPNRGREKRERVGDPDRSRAYGLFAGHWSR